MRRWLDFLLLVSSIAFPLCAHAEHRRDLVRVPTPDESSMRVALALGLDVVSARPGIALEVLVPPGGIERIRAAGLSCTLLRQDLGRELAERTRRSRAIGRDFGDGSMGGFYTIEETFAILDSLLAYDPHGIMSDLDTIGTSTYGRPIVAFSVSDNPGIDEGEPEVLYDGVHHAREPMGLMNVIYFLEHLLDNYGSSPRITFLVNERNLVFVPIVNPDGYAVNESIYVDEGSFGFWRKNARDNNEDGIINDGDGVDLNRNYGFMWGFDDIGSSPVPEGETYRGPSAFSEPETRALRDLCEASSFGLALNYHSYGDLLIYPFGYNDTETPDSLTFREIAHRMTRVNNYQYGTGTETVNYTTNGDSDDWMYGEQGTKEKIYAMTPEVGNYEDFFWPAPERILPLVQENLESNIFLAMAAGAHLVRSAPAVLNDDTGDGDGYADAGEILDLAVGLKNVGISEAATGISCDLATSSPSVTVVKAHSTLGDAGAGEETGNTGDPFVVQIADSITEGEIARFVLQIAAAEGYAHTDSFDLILGTPDEIFYDGAEEGMANFSSTTWDVDPLHPSAGILSFTDSPSGTYRPNANAIMTGLFELDLSRSTNAYLLYDTRWEIERDWDFGQIEMSRDGSTWTALEATGTFPGSGYTYYHDPVEEGYHARSLFYSRERADLAEFTGPGNEHVRLRFILRSDNGMEFDGWYVDEIRVHSYGATTGVGGGDGERRIPAVFRLGQNFPNPFNPVTTFSFEIPEGSGDDVSLALYDIRGRLVKTIVRGKIASGTHRMTWDGRTENGEMAASGVYMMKLTSGQNSAVRKILLLK